MSRLELDLHSSCLDVTFFDIQSNEKYLVSRFVMLDV